MDIRVYLAIHLMKGIPGLFMTNEAAMIFCVHINFHLSVVNVQECKYWVRFPFKVVLDPPVAPQSY